MERQLRVSVYARGRMVDDRYIPPKALASKGFLPKEYELFASREGRPLLVPPAGARGEVAVDGRHPRPLTSAEVDLGPDAKGWVDVGGARLFFQMTPPPAPVPRPVLARSVRFGLFASLEKGFVAALAAVLALEGVAIWRAHRHAVPDDDLDIAVNPVDEAPVFELPRLTTTAPPKPIGRAHDGLEQPRHAPHVDHAPGAGLLEVLGAALDGPMSDVFRHPLPNIDVHLAPPPVGDPAPRHHGIGDPHQVDIAMDGPTHDDRGLQEHARPTGPRVQVDWDPTSLPASGSLDLAGKILAAVRSRQSAVQHCYERALKLTPGLKGRVTLAFSVQHDGRVTDVDVVDESLGSPDVDACVTAAVSAWRLPVFPPEPTPVEFPFVLSRAN